MRELPILFTGDMVLPTVAGTKDVTRRTRGLKEINENPNEWTLEALEENPDLIVGYKANGDEKIKKKDGLWATFNYTGMGDIWRSVKCPYGTKGDLLYVRENFAQVVAQYSSDDSGDNFYLSKRQIFHYMADGPLRVKGPNNWNVPVHTLKKEGFCPYNGDCFWKRYPSIHLPKENSRIWLLNEGVTIERLQDITEEEAKREGITWNKGPVQSGYGVKGSTTHLSAHSAFIALWDSINGPGGFAANPFVWRIQYSVLSTTGKPILAQPVTPAAYDGNKDDMLRIDELALFPTNTLNPKK